MKPMPTSGFIFFIAAVVLHGIIILFGGLLFNHDEQAASKRDIELVAEEMDAEKERQEEQPPPPEELKEQEEQPPEATQAPSAVDVSAGDDAPALDAASLSALEAALGGGGSSGGDFGGGASLASGGRIGGKGGPNADGEEFTGAFSMSEIDQRPRALMQVAAGYPSEMRARKAEGVVTVIFVVDETGRVVNPRVEKATHPEFEKPALEAVRQWKFEPAIKGGKRVSCRMRVPFRFQPK
jgi:protein TonB